MSTAELFICLFHDNSEDFTNRNTKKTVVRSFGIVLRSCVGSYKKNEQPQSIQSKADLLRPTNVYY